MKDGQYFLKGLWRDLAGQPEEEQIRTLPASCSERGSNIIYCNPTVNLYVAYVNHTGQL